MSSAYHLICMSHDPGIVLEPEYVGEAAVAQIRFHPALGQHAGCDLLVGQWSGGIVAVGCPGGAPSARCEHTDLRWTVVYWLKLIHAARLACTPDAGKEIDPLAEVLSSVPSCWTYPRINGLREVLELPATP